MAVTTITARQSPLVAIASVTTDTTGANTVVIKVPPAAYVTRFFGEVVTAFNSGTSDALGVSDGTTTIVSAFNAQSTAGTLVTIASNSDQKYYPSGGTITATLTATGTAPTAGHILFGVEYVGRDRLTEIQE